MDEKRVVVLLTIVGIISIIAASNEVTAQGTHTWKSSVLFYLGLAFLLPITFPVFLCMCYFPLWCAGTVMRPCCAAEDRDSENVSDENTPLIASEPCDHVLEDYHLTRVYKSATD
eukprot:TRINITY_DN1148_c0_g3_i2.p1 TRINITY_DN1148_c0_g3~~TRINITY_DN1148_c0_g3_i2.p1  ORF type:complete len:115 (+),score=13.07 TRINITY_DN1148_c0_g3_i2:66-410(+)